MSIVAKRSPIAATAEHLLQGSVATRLRFSGITSGKHYKCTAYFNDERIVKIGWYLMILWARYSGWVLRHPHIILLCVHSRAVSFLSPLNALFVNNTRSSSCYVASGLACLITEIVPRISPKSVICKFSIFPC